MGGDQNAELRRVLVTGGGGFLGSAVCRQLAALGLEAVAFQRSTPHPPASPRITSIEGDITRPADVERALAGCDAVIHTAGKAGIWGRPADFWRVNADGTANVIRACLQQGVSRLVYTSSPSIVHTGRDIGGADESLSVATRFRAPYPASKAEGERRVLEANGERLRTVALRPHLIWGPGDPHILPRLAARARRGVIALPGPDKVIDTIFVENAARAHVLALQELAATGRCAGRPYFVTNGEPMPQGEIIRRLLAAIGLDVRVRAVPVPLAKAAGAVCEWIWSLLRLPSEPPTTRFAVEQLATAHWFDISAAERDFGYHPTITIAEGLDRLRLAYAAQPA